ncbi:Tmtc4 [Symbiodinium natans]|uniref:Tmtc4 protein n=1 Tax=Symbiodinium natans TaxID=878477 RepID=A0A812G5Y9_9DINO|nr:Tmtc4 [Symbiodinium natans]
MPRRSRRLPGRFTFFLMCLLQSAVQSWPWWLQVERLRTLEAKARVLDWFETLMRACYAPFFYIWQTFVPPWTWTTPRYALPDKLDFTDAHFAAALASATVTTSALAFFAYSATPSAYSWIYRPLWMAWVTYLSLLLPTLGVVSTHVWALAADRYVYLPSLCVFVPCTAGLLQSLAEGASWKRRGVLGVLSMTYIFSCAWRADEVALHWASGSSTLFEAILREEPSQFHTLKDFGTFQLKRGKLGEAKAMLSHALQIRPDHGGLLLNVAALLHQSKETAEAEAMYRKACAAAKAAAEKCQGCQPAMTELAKAQANYGGLLLQLGRHTDAASVLEAGQPWENAVDSARGPGFFHLCLAHRGLGRLESALRNCHAAAAAHSTAAQAVLRQHEAEVQIQGLR